MARGETTQAKVHFKGTQDDYLVFVDDVETYKKWVEGDTSIPLAHFVSSFKVFRTHNQGVQGTYDAAAKGTLQSEFGTDVEDDVIKIILEKGTLQTSEMPERQGPKNDSMGAMVSH
ncbi:ribosome maturation protein [Thelonectria olida]|uniref:Ribosome maturation protein n=1 Tax=Thelonectria olida TaxID=1576542 RepID=A0A9P8WJD7_9HYPO|nr:ribosome maturation protein [Thelonectria olida]